MISIEEDFSIEKLRSGDRREFARLVEMYSGRIYNLGLRILNDPQDAEDVLQETFIKAYRALPSFEGRSKLSTWLFRIASNEALMLIRKRRPELILTMEQHDNQPVGTDLEEPEIVDWCCLPEKELLSTEAKQFLDKAIQKLSASLRVVFVLRDIEGLSIRETSESLGISEAAVKIRLLRARLKLREELTEYYGERLSERLSDE